MYVKLKYTLKDKTELFEIKETRLTKAEFYSEVSFLFDDTVIQITIPGKTIFLRTSDLYSIEVLGVGATRESLGG